MISARWRGAAAPLCFDLREGLPRAACSARRIAPAPGTHGFQADEPREVVDVKAEAVIKPASEAEARVADIPHPQTSAPPPPAVTCLMW